MATRSTLTRITTARNLLPILTTDNPVVVFPSSVLGVWKLDETLQDDVSQNNLTPSTGSAQYTQFDKYDLLSNEILTRNGLKFETDKSYSVSATYSYSTNFTLAFWWFSPGLVGFTRHVTTRELEPKVAPIIAKSGFTTNSSQTSLQNSSFVVTEIGYSKTQNALRIHLSTDGSIVSHIITSEAYEPGLHHVLLTYISAQGRFRVDIDGKAGILHSAPTTSLQKTGDLTINNIVPGFTAHKTTQTDGYLFDLVFTNYASQDNESLKAFRYGYEHISFEHLFDTRFFYFGMSYAQPSTTSTTHIFTDGGSVFVARSNGEIAKGDRAIWDKEFDYPNTDSITLLTTSEIDKDAECNVESGQQEEIKKRLVQWTNNGICVRGATIRI